MSSQEADGESIYPAVIGVEIARVAKIMYKR